METRTMLVVILVFLAGMVSGAGLSSCEHHHEMKAHCAPNDALKINTEAVAAIAAKRAKLEEEKEKH